MAIKLAYLAPASTSPKNGQPSFGCRSGLRCPSPCYLRGVEHTVLVTTSKHWHWSNRKHKGVHHKKKRTRLVCSGCDLPIIEVARLQGFFGLEPQHFARHDHNFGCKRILGALASSVVRRLLRYKGIVQFGGNV